VKPSPDSSPLQRLRRLAAHPEFRAGAREISGVAPGLAAWGLMTGVAMVQSGMSTVEAVAMTLLVFAGSSQLAAIPLIAASAPVWVILATSFCVNLRFVVFSAHLRAYVMYLPRWARLLAGYVTADMTYVLFVRRYAHPATAPAEREAQLAYLAGGGALNWASWQLASLTGIALAQSVPLHWGLGFAGILALTGVACSLASIDDAARLGRGGRCRGRGGICTAVQAQHRVCDRRGGGAEPAAGAARAAGSPRRCMTRRAVPQANSTAVHGAEVHP
jgi:predicted branched-subunit amino acid permease